MRFSAVQHDMNSHAIHRYNKKTDFFIAMKYSSVVIMGQILRKRVAMDHGVHVFVYDI